MISCSIVVGFILLQTKNAMPEILTEVGFCMPDEYGFAIHYTIDRITEKDLSFTILNSSSGSMISQFNRSTQLGYVSFDGGRVWLMHRGKIDALETKSVVVSDRTRAQKTVERFSRKCLVDVSVNGKVSEITIFEAKKPYNVLSRTAFVNGQLVASSVILQAKAPALMSTTKIKELLANGLSRPSSIESLDNKIKALMNRS